MYVALKQRHPSSAFGTFSPRGGEKGFEELPREILLPLMRGRRCAFGHRHGIRWNVALAEGDLPQGGEPVVSRQPGAERRGGAFRGSGRSCGGVAGCMAGSVV